MTQPLTSQTNHIIADPELAHLRSIDHAALYKAAGVIHSTLDYDEVLQEIAKQLCTATGATSAFFFSFDASKATSTLLSEYLSENACAKERKSDLGRTYQLAEEFPRNVSALRSGEAILYHLNDPDLDPQTRADLEEHGGQSVLTIPLRINGETGVFTEIWESRYHRAFTENEIALAVGITQQAPVAIKNARTYAETRRNLREQTALRTAISAISSTLDLTTVLNRIAEQMGLAVDATSAYICEWIADPASLKVLVEYYSPEASSPERVSDLGEVYSEWDEEFVSKMTNGIPYTEHIDNPDLPDFEQAYLEQYGANTVIYIPLIVRGKLTAIAELWDSRQNRDFTSDEIELVKRIAQHGALAIQNAGLFAKMQVEISERHQAEQERSILLKKLQDQADNTQRIIDTIPEGILLLDKDYSVVSSNRLGSEYLSILSGSEGSERVARLGEINLASTLDSPDGTSWFEVEQNDEFFEVRMEPLVSTERSRGLVLVIREITQERESRRLIQRQEQLASLGQLASGISHDFNNILTVIMLYAKMLKNELSSDPPKSHERLSVIYEQASRGSDLVQQILDFSRSSVLELKTIDLVDFLRQQLNLLERTLPESINIKLRTVDNECLVLADSSRLQQVMMNLALNSRDAMPNGGELVIKLESLSMRAEEVPENFPEGASNENCVQISVTDNGVGIDGNTLPHIFEPFYSTKEPGKGTGLGLAQVWGIVQQHSGLIEVESTVGQGSTFRISLPVMMVGEAKEIIEDVDIRVGQGEIILVVEDEPSVRTAVVEVLEAIGYQTMTATNGIEAINLLEEKRGNVDLIVSDLIMPEMGGREMLREMKKLGLMTPCIILSGHPISEDLSEDDLNNLAGWVQKPPSVQHLAREISRVLYGPPTPRRGWRYPTNTEDVIALQ